MFDIIIILLNFFGIIGSIILCIILMTNIFIFKKVSFKRKLYIAKINIYETFHSGGVKEVKVMNPSGNWTTIWSTSAVQDNANSTIFSPSFQVLYTYNSH